MTTELERVLAKARLPRRPYDGTRAAEARLTARINKRMWQGALSFDDQMEPARAAAARAAERAVLPHWAHSRHLDTLCQTVVAQDLPRLGTFLSRRILEPEAARVLGCVLHLAHRSESAQFWWQFAGGAGDIGAACCLYLHHMALGERYEAKLWRDQANLEVAPPATPEFINCNDFIAALRILEHLRDEDSRFSAAATAVIAYVPDALGFVDDVELPLPDADFATRIEELTAST
ncbi:hypothetical protein EYS09_07885 [Streptomyces kasugaensis]|uniref:Uncharacterized protein n=1 Tax=Streptomyces kasugaensis TaxID=1946 RepID=A0A4V2JIW6_STRKA|nr:hypothetical protein [Streptomyces kasugaensis]TBO60211.1 hypothetical protein EYS09_07885 [Streptomyces kasugaensis]